MLRSFAALLALAAAQLQAAEPANPPPGEWVSRDYGYHLSATATGYRVFDVLGDGCTRRADEAPLFDAFQPAGDARLLAYSTHEPYGYAFQRASAPCRVIEGDEPALNMAAVKRFFRQHYAFDAERHVPPGATVERSGERLDAPTLRAFLQQYRDSHVSFEGTLDGEDVAIESDSGRMDEIAAKVPAPFLKTFWSSHVAQAVLGGKGRFFANRRIQSGVLDSGIGYVALVSMGGYADAGGDDLAVLDAALRDILADFRAHSVRGVVIDLSANSGGYDHLARRLASQFTDRPTVLYRKSTRGQADSPQALSNDPVESPLPVPLAVLTSNLTVSAAEVATLSLRAVGALHLGETTRGALSDALVKYLPNGDRITLSNEVYLDSDGIAWEARGITPHLARPNLLTEDPLASHLALVREAAARLLAMAPSP